MQIPCEIDNIKTLKKGMKITLAVDDENVKSVMKDIYNFMDRSLLVDININAEEEQAKLNMISPEQRKKIYALFNDIANHTGGNKDYVKDELKKRFVEDTEYEMFSLSNCSRELASDFIEYLIEFAFEYGVELSEHPKKLIDDIEAYIRICLKRKICCICGRPYSGDPHHVDAIQMGHDRRKVDDSQKRKLPLCYEIHHPEIHNIGDKAFCEKYHVKGVIYND